MKADPKNKRGRTSCSWNGLKVNKFFIGTGSGSYKRTRSTNASHLSGRVLR